VLLACKRYFRTIGSVPGHARGAVALAEQAMFSTPPRESLSAFDGSTVVMRGLAPRIHLL
jgi:hypothetical protein